MVAASSFSEPVTGSLKRVSSLPEMVFRQLKMASTPPAVPYNNINVRARAKMMLAETLADPNKNLVTKNWKNCGTNLIFFVYLCTIYGYKSTFRNYRK